jgi:hypothetical protein
MSGAGLDSSASSEEVFTLTRSAMRAMSGYLSSSSFLAEDAMATRTPASRARRSRSGTAENGRTSGRCSVLKRLLRHSSIHPKAMPVILTTPEEVETWMTAPSEEALKLQGPLLDGSLRMVARGVKEDPASAG